MVGRDGVWYRGVITMLKYTSKKGCLNEILDAGILANNQLPDVFWELDITGKELQVLRYVWSNVVRLHRTVRVAPRGRDGSPRFWKDKEKMAVDCRMSCPTFRNAVRSLYKQGLTTSMDGIDDLEKILIIDDTTHCIGLNLQYFNTLGISFQPEMDRTSREYIIHLVDDICPKLYDKTTVDLIRETTLRLLDLEDKEAIVDVTSSTTNEPVTEDDQLKDTQEFKTCPKNCYEVVLEDGVVIVVDKSVQRMPITITKTPISTPRIPDVALQRKERSKRMMEKILQERDRLFVLTAKEQEIMKVAHYYEYKCRVATGKSGWRSLGNNFREHRNWKYFIRIFEMCQKNKWNYKIYIDAQFDRVRFWTHPNCKGYPYPNQFFSDKAIKYFHKYQQDYQQRYSVDGTPARVKVSKVVSYQEEVINAVIKDCDHFVQFFKIAPKQRKYQGLTPEQMKFGYIIDHVASLSQYYWASLPWAVSYLKRFSTPWVVELTSTVAKIQSSKSMVNIISQIVDEVENQLGIPHTVLPGVD